MSESRKTNLIRLLRNETWKTSYPDLEAMADTVLAHGWAPVDPVIIDTVEELDGYPIGTVIRVGGGLCAQRVVRASYCWMFIGDANRLTSEQISDGVVIELLYTPVPQV